MADRLDDVVVKKSVNELVAEISESLHVRMTNLAESVGDVRKEMGG